MIKMLLSVEWFLFCIDERVACVVLITAHVDRAFIVHTSTVVCFAPFSSSIYETPLDLGDSFVSFSFSLFLIFLSEFHQHLSFCLFLLCMCFLLHTIAAWTQGILHDLHLLWSLEFGDLKYFSQSSFVRVFLVPRSYCEMTACTRSNWESVGTRLRVMAVSQDFLTQEYLLPGKQDVFSRWHCLNLVERWLGLTWILMTCFFAIKLSWDVFAFLSVCLLMFLVASVF